MGSVPGLERFPGKGNGNPLQYSYPESSMNKEAWQGAVQGVTEFRQDWVPKHTGMQIYTCIFYYFLDHNTFIFFMQWDTIYPKCWMISFFFLLYLPLDLDQSLIKVYQEVSKNTFLASMTINYTCSSVTAVSTSTDSTHHGLSPHIIC